MGYFPEPWWLVLRLQQGGSSGLALAFWGKTYTFHAQDVYVSYSKRIRFRRKTYTFYSRYVYVATKQGIRSTEKPYALGDRRTEARGGKGKLIMGKTYSIPREG